MEDVIKVLREHAARLEKAADILDGKKPAHREMSVEARKRIAAAQRKRWAAVRASDKKLKRAA